MADEKKAAANGSGLNALMEQAACEVTVLVLGVEKWSYEENGQYGSRVHWCQVGGVETGSINGWIPRVSKYTEQDQATGHRVYNDLMRHQLPAYFRADLYIMPKQQILDNFRSVAALEAR